MSSQAFFGTDGIRGVAGAPPLDERTVRTLGARLAARLGTDANVVLGGDTRDSTAVIAGWLAAGLASRGATVTYLGTVPTPCVAYVTRRGDAAAGVAVSASHNPHPDNGIKLIGGDGFKWHPDDEAGLEQDLRAACEAGGEAQRVDPPELVTDKAAVATYFDDLARQVPGEKPLAGLRIALDTAHGAAAPHAERFFDRLGAELIVIGDRPDGQNINQDRGSTHPETLAARTREAGCVLGCAFDGDADRVIIADADGKVHDGDAMLYLWARDLAAQDRLPGRSIVATSMSNLGLEVALARHDITLVRCGVGDREVVATLRRGGLRLGGEQSGHLVDLERSTTGDGLLTAVVMAQLVQRANRPLADLLDGFERFPQRLKNVRVRSKPDLATLDGVTSIRREVEDELGEHGRLVLRYSGTEPLARVMIEAPDLDQVERLTDRLVGAISEAIGAD